MAMVGLSLKEISSSQPKDVQVNKIRKHKSEQQTIKKKNKNKTRNNKVLNIPKYNNYNIYTLIIYKYPYILNNIIYYSED
jgi:GTPase Era involved in 16S rRNA processing